LIMSASNHSAIAGKPLDTSGAYESQAAGESRFCVLCCIAEKNFDRVQSRTAEVALYLTHLTSKVESSLCCDVPVVGIWFVILGHVVSRGIVKAEIADNAHCLDPLKDID